MKTDLKNEYQPGSPKLEWLELKGHSMSSEALKIEIRQRGKKMVILSVLNLLLKEKQINANPVNLAYLTLGSRIPGIR